MLAKLQRYFSEKLEKSDEAALPQNTIELAIVSLLLQIGIADGKIQPEEHTIIKKFIAENFSLDTETIKKLISFAEDDLEQATSLQGFTHLLNESLSPTEKISIVEKLWEVAFADQSIDKYEEYYVRKIADLLYVPHTAYIKAKHRATHRE